MGGEAVGSRQKVHLWRLCLISPALSFLFLWGEGLTMILFPNWAKFPSVEPSKAVCQRKPFSPYVIQQLFAHKCANQKQYSVYFNVTRNINIYQYFLAKGYFVEFKSNAILRETWEARGNFLNPLQAFHNEWTQL